MENDAELKEIVEKTVHATGFSVDDIYRMVLKTIKFAKDCQDFSKIQE